MDGRGERQERGGGGKEGGGSYYRTDKDRQTIQFFKQFNLYMFVSMTILKLTLTELRHNSIRTS